MNGLVDMLQRHGRAVYLLVLLTCAAGWLAYQHLPSDVYPNLTFARIAVIATTGDTAPERALLATTRVLEEAASQVYHVSRVRSKTIRGSSELSVEFEEGTDLTIALHQLQARIAEAQTALPPGTAITIEPVTPAIFPVMSFNITTDTLTQADLYTICRYQVVPSLSRVAGVARVQIQGGDISEIAVQVNAGKLKSYHLSISRLCDRLSKINQQQVIGRLNEAHQTNLLVAGGEALDREQLSHLVIAELNGKPVYLQDIATVTLGNKDRLSAVSVKQKKAVVVNIFKQPNANVLDVAAGVKSNISRLLPSLQAGLSVEPAYNESNLVRSALKNVMEAILIGMALIAIVLLAFLRSWKSTLIAALSIPISALAACVCLYLCGQSLNLMSLGGLAIAVGLVIDDAIVVVENISRQLASKGDLDAAVRQAIHELTGPVTSSTITTVVVFLPLGLLSGVAGQFFTSLTVALTAAVLFSWLLSLTLMPLLAGALLRNPARVEKAVDETDAGTGLSLYGRTIKRLLNIPWLVLPITAAIIYATVNLYGQLSTDFLPTVDEGSYVLDYLAPSGIALPDMDRLANQLEEVVSHTPEVVTWTRRSGSELGLFATQTNKGDILVVLKPSAERKRDIETIMEEQRQSIERDLPQLQVDFHQILQDELNDLSGAPRPVEVRIFGEDPEVLRKWAASIKDKISSVAGLADLSSTSQLSAPQDDLQIDNLAAGRLGLTAADVLQQVQDSLIGRQTSQLRVGDRLIPIRVRLEDTLRQSPEALSQIPVFGVGGNFLPLSALATVVRKASESEILCENQMRYISVEAELEKRDLGSTVKEIASRLAGSQLPQGYRLEIAGLFASQQKSFSQLLFVLILSSLLVYCVLVVQFRSFIQPAAILISIPLAVFGVTVALICTGTALNVSSFMGVILLVGLVVKNGIILLDYANKLHASGLAIDHSIAAAASVRLRPIMMTTICTILGLLPLAIGLGSGAEMQKPLAIAVIGGLTFSTIFTLFFVPPIFYMLARLTPPKDNAHQPEGQD